MKKIVFVIVLVSFALVVSSCAAGPNQLRNTPDEDGEVAGFWMGLWHGLISPITFVVSLFSKTVYIAMNMSASVTSRTKREIRIFASST